MKRTIYQSLLAAMIIFVSIFLLAYLMSHGHHRDPHLVNHYLGNIIPSS